MQKEKEIIKDIEQRKIEPSFTALSVMGGYLRGLKMRFGYLVDKIDIALSEYLYLRAIGEDPNWTRRNCVNFFNSLYYGIQATIVDNIIKPGYDAHMVGRKIFIKDTIEQAIKNGTKHIIILGGGYDPRAFLVAQAYQEKYPDLRIYELDRGSTRRIKIDALRNIPEHLGIPQPKVTELDEAAIQFNENLVCIECDFTEDNLEETLTRYGYKKGEEALVIGEGLSMYLTFGQIRQLLSSLAALFSENSQFLVSFIPFVSEISSAHQAAINSSKEEYKTSLKPEEVIPFIAEQGFQVKAKLFGESIQEAMGNHHVVELERKKPTMGKENYYLLQTDPNNEGIKTIEEVPHITFAIPPKEENKEKEVEVNEEDEKDSSTCSLM